MDKPAVEEQPDVLPINGDKAEDESSAATTSGFRAIAALPKMDDEDTGDARELSREDSSSVSSVNPDMLGDEIIVGTHANGDKASPLRVVSDAEDGDVAFNADEEPIAHYPKRKRASLYNDLGEDKMDISIAETPPKEVGTPRSAQTKPAIASPHGAKGITIGYWRDSPVPTVEGKHSVIGFMDVRDRLRTRIHTITTSGEMINPRLFPIPPGPGGSWVTFERIVFDDHLVGLDHNEIKEYVKIRAEGPLDETPETRLEGQIKAAKEARSRLQANPAPETAQPPSIAYGLEIPEHAQVSRHEAKRRRLVGSNALTPDRLSNNNLPGRAQTPIGGTTTGSATPVQIYPGMLDSLHGTRPTRILVGCWAKSDVTDDRERHAVYGILGANDMFRVKLVRETLDGRYVDGNFPAGAGALWIPYEEVLFLPHISHLSRPEMKEYVRVRQSQIDAGEKEDEKVSNETKAIYEAQTRASLLGRGASYATIPRQSYVADREEVQDHLGAPTNGNSHELRHQRRDVLSRNETTLPRHPLPDADMRQITRPASQDPVDKVQGLATREIARMEAVQLRHDRQNQSRYPVGGNAADSVEHHRHSFQENRDRMQKVWQSQEQSRIRAGIEDAKMHMGIKYERKQNGPFSGKLVSQGAILTIDGEDYVEYRVLTKPSFF
ncbi:hypothetical protein F4808DRAFT_48851 [Astrocystis sublimbata]|nr:hypothetical protein F4808DRAFT_48851 [Astrocystis sublimbata]